MSERNKLIADLKASPTPDNVRLLATLLGGLPIVGLRHSLIADYVRAGHTGEQAVEHFGVTLPVVVVACRGAKVPLPPTDKRPGPQPAYHLIAALLRGQPQPEIVKQFAVSKQRVHQIAAKMRKAGIFSACRKSNGSKG